MSRRRRVVIVDLLFHWPATGGSWVDVHGVATELLRRGYDVTLVTPHWTTFFPRGDIREQPGFRCVRVPFTTLSFTPENVCAGVLAAVRELRPDVVLVADGYYLKPYLVRALKDAGYPVLLRLYAYEMLCPRNNHIYRGLQRRVCDTTYVDDPAACLRCLLPKPNPAKQLLRVATWAERNARGRPKVTAAQTPGGFTHELVVSGALRPSRYGEVLREGIAAADHVVVYNPWTAAAVKPLNPRVRIVPTGVDTTRFTPAESAPRERPVILMSGRAADPLKGLPVFRRALRILWRRGYELEAKVTHPPVEFKEPYLSAVGWLAPSELPKLYQSSDICVNPSTWREPFGITAVEAMACGKPVVASDTGGHQVTVADGVTGWRYPPPDAEALADRLQRLLDDPSMRASFGAQGRRKAEQEFGWEPIMERHYLPLLESL